MKKYDKKNNIFVEYIEEDLNLIRKKLTDAKIKFSENINGIFIDDDKELEANDVLKLI